MGNYFNPPESLPEIGRELRPGSYYQLLDQLETEEKLIGLYNRGSFYNAVHLYCPDEFGEFERQAKEGIILREGYFAVNSTKARTFMDHGWKEQE